MKMTGLRLNRSEIIITDMLFQMASETEVVASARFATAIVLKKRVISVGTNRKKTHPLQSKYSKNPMAICIHAENDAIIKALRGHTIDDLKKATMYIVRVKKASKSAKNMSLGLARPCSGCQQSIAAYGLKHIVYSNDDGKFECL
jgi:deoxycytidylate deaminase